MEMDFDCLAARDLPSAAAARLAAAYRAGNLLRPYHGVYVNPVFAASPPTLVKAAQLACPRGVLLAGAAASLTLDLPFTPPVHMAIDRGDAKPGLVFHRWTVPEDLLRRSGVLTFASPAFAAAHLAATDEGRAIDQALRLGVRLADIEAAAAWMTATLGNRVRRQVIRDSRDQPWSPAERLGQRTLRAAGISGWVSNHHVRTPEGDFFLDIAFVREKVAVEIDGYEYHSSRESFERDRVRHSILTAMGWRILHVTWGELIHHPERVVSLVRDTLRVATSPGIL